MTEFRFRTHQELTRAAFEEASVWVEWEEPEQDIEIASWGVDVAAAWKRRRAEPDPNGEYFYPYLGNTPVSLVRGTHVGAEARFSSGQTLPGYLTGGFAFAVFCGDEEIMFNVNMKREGQEAAARVARHLGVPEATLFPITFLAADGRSAKYEKYW
ncbi:hypothetical protein SAMN05518854_1064 [Variovorax sp. YR266]|uniref:hypothetical protein n=1 Tax=Variovorax sp. YR266 TaxID=1884386 RepID=UPI00089D1A92|nr:hypothetical protein [Variovorax sp. YR266]SDZ42064.1 hypothetical protein SAMN05518854_1064 [Variovorax sp. YR266]